MICSLTQNELIDYINKQLNNFFPDSAKHNSLDKVIVEALSKTEYCFKHVTLKHYYKEEKLYFNHLNSDQFTIFIYFASNIAYQIYKDEILANKLFYLNKILNQFHCMYTTVLPNIFLVVHSVGIVLGKAKYSDYFVIHQHCTVGANSNLEYPSIGKNVIMYPNSSIVGKSIIGSSCSISNGSFINNTQIPSKHYIFGDSPHLRFKKKDKNKFEYFFDKMSESQ